MSDEDHSGDSAVPGNDSQCHGKNKLTCLNTCNESFEIETKKKLNCITRSNYAPEALTGKIRDIIYIDVCKSRG